MPRIYILPLLIFMIIAAALFAGLFLKPAEIPSARVGNLAPETNLPALFEDSSGIDMSNIRNGNVKLVNIFASWCVPCIVEHPYLMELQRLGVDIFAINYKDTPEDAKDFLLLRGNPFSRVGQDPDGRAGIDWGVTGVPETFVVDGEGRIIYQHIGPLSTQAIRQDIMPLLRRDEMGSDQ